MRRLLILTVPGLLTACVATPSEPVFVPGEEPAAPASRPATLFAEESPSAGVLGPDTIAVPGVPQHVADGTFETKGATAVTYDPRIVPSGATARVAVGEAAAGTTVRIAVTGMLPRRTYGAHLHTKPCAPAAPASAGPHYQHSPDPKASASPPSVDPSFANPRNEVWLDFTADRDGAATATAVVPWRFDQFKPPRSLVVHASRTRTEEGLAGTAGDRVACLTLPG